MSRLARELCLLSPIFCLLACGYHVSGHADALPKSIKTIAVPAFSNATTRYKLTDRMAVSVQRELVTRTRYRVVNDPNQADAILRGSVVTYFVYPTTFDSVTGRAAAVQMHVALSVTLYDRATGAVLFTRPNFEVRERYEISTQPEVYFEESDVALDRLSRQVARAIVSAVLENF